MRGLKEKRRKLKQEANGKAHRKMEKCKKCKGKGWERKNRVGLENMKGAKRY